MFGGVILCGIYYFAASLVFPDEPRSWPDLDRWFWLHRRSVLACILAANLAWTPIVLSIGVFKPSFLQILLILTYFAMLGATIWTSNRRLLTAALGILIAQNLALAVIDLVSRSAVS
jgi:hypothetical protein